VNKNQAKIFYLRTNFILP